MVDYTFASTPRGPALLHAPRLLPTSHSWLACPSPLSLTESFDKSALSVSYVPETQQGTKQTTNKINMAAPECAFSIIASLRRGTGVPSLCLDRPHRGWALPASWSHLSTWHWWGRDLAQLEDRVWAESCVNGLELEWRPRIEYRSRFVGESQEEGSKFSFFRVCENGLHPPNLWGVSCSLCRGIKGA